MIHLIRDYFERDLSPAEEESLAKALESDPAACESFAQEARRAYLELDLDEPMPGGKMGNLPGVRWRAWLLKAKTLLFPGLTGLVLLWGGLMWYSWQRESPSAPAGFEGDAESMARQGETLPYPEGGETSSRPAAQAAHSRELAHPASRPHPQVRPARIHKNQGPAPSAAVKAGPAPDAYAAVSAEVNLDSGKSVTVRVVDGQGREVKRLYSGWLEPGLWSFTWDGKDSGGAAISEGTYWIELTAGSFKQKKAVLAKGG